MALPWHTAVSQHPQQDQDTQEIGHAVPEINWGSNQSWERYIPMQFGWNFQLETLVQSNENTEYQLDTWTASLYNLQSSCAKFLRYVGTASEKKFFQS